MGSGGATWGDGRNDLTQELKKSTQDQMGSYWVEFSNIKDIFDESHYSYGVIWGLMGPEGTS